MLPVVGSNVPVESDYAIGQWQHVSEHVQTMSVAPVLCLLAYGASADPAIHPSTYRKGGGKNAQRAHSHQQSDREQHRYINIIITCYSNGNSFTVTPFHCTHTDRHKRTRAHTHTHACTHTDTHTHTHTKKHSQRNHNMLDQVQSPFISILTLLRSKGRDLGDRSTSHFLDISNFADHK